MNPEKLQQQVQQLQNELNTLKAQFAVHQHDGIDGTNPLRKALTIDVDQVNTIGASNHFSRIVANGTTDVYLYGISVGEGYKDARFVQKSNDMQMVFNHSPLQDNSSVTVYRKPIVIPYENTSISVTSGGNTVTIAGYNFTTNELAGAYININNSSGTFIETRKIASNTATVITISGTWGASTGSATFFIYKPVLLGESGLIYERLYVDENGTGGTGDGGIRFGVGPTAGGQNGLLYMDATGDLYWRNKSGTSTKLN